MNNEWTDLKTGKEVFDRQAEGWEINAKYDGAWHPWLGDCWSGKTDYRGRPAQPKTKTKTKTKSKTKTKTKKVKLEAWLDSRAELRLFANSQVPYVPNWTRVPSEDKEIEVAA